MADVAAQSMRPKPRLRACNEPRWVHARHRGVCIGCKSPYAVGTLIQYDAATDRYIAECCAPEEVAA
jgi:hypothetical protein